MNKEKKSSKKLINNYKKNNGLEINIEGLKTRTLLKVMQNQNKKWQLKIISYAFKSIRVDCQLNQSSIFIILPSVLFFVVVSFYLPLFIFNPSFEGVTRFTKFSL